MCGCAVDVKSHIQFNLHKSARYAISQCINTSTLTALHMERMICVMHTNGKRLQPNDVPWPTGSHSTGLCVCVCVCVEGEGAKSRNSYPKLKAEQFSF